MEYASFVLDVGTRLWNCTAGYASYITDLEETLTSLRAKMEELKAIRDDVKLKVQLAEEQSMMQSKQVEDWLKRVQEMETTVNEIRVQHEEISRSGSTCLKICQCRSSYKLGKKSTKTLQDIEHLISRGEFREVAIQQPYPALTRETEGWCEMPMGIQNIVGIESNLEKVLKGLKDDNVGIIGLYGMGGVGKTTLLKKINNGLPKSGDDAFDLAIWAVASRNATIEIVQQKLMSKLKIPYETMNDTSVDDVRNIIYKTLKNRKYILMLDDVWKTLDLFEKVGMPEPNKQNKSKIIFTTRSKGVCFQMEAQLLIEVECLSWEEAWSMFQEKVGKATLNNQIESYAMQVAKECKGLPLALITLGRAMTGKDSPYEWSHALDRLQNCPVEFEYLEDVFPSLQLSYDNLADLTKQRCFLYCSLFPEDYSIPSSKLVHLWMGEGYLNNKKHGITKARDYGYSIIAGLKRACLLENGSSLDFESVKMHDIIRDMALRISKKKFLFLENSELMRDKSNDQDWNEDVEKMSLWGTQWEKEKMSLYKGEDGSSSKRDEGNLTLTRECPKLSTLLYKLSPRVSLMEVLNFIPHVRVLDLSESRHLVHLPEVISKLENLEYLDVSFTGLKRLPKVMKRLRKLRYLLMNFMPHLEECPTEIISDFTDLVVFRMEYNPPISEELLRGLEKLQNIHEISIYLDSAESMNFFLKSKKLQLCTTHMELRKTSEMLEWCPTNMRNLESVFIRFSNIVSLKSSNPATLMAFNCLYSVRILCCDSLVELDFLVYAPSLVELRVGNCKSIQRILRIEEEDHVFLSLKEIYLDDLPCLEKLCNKALSFPALEIIEIRKCPKLEQNPFNDMLPTNNNLRKIMCDSIWWDSLEWKDDLKHHFCQYFTENADRKNHMKRVMMSFRNL